MLADSSSPGSLAAASIRDEIGDNRLQFAFFMVSVFQAVWRTSIFVFPVPHTYASVSVCSVLCS